MRRNDGLRKTQSLILFFFAIVLAADPLYAWDANSMCAPSLISPDDGAEVLVGTDQIFTCGTVGTATGYKIRFDAGTLSESTMQMDANRRFKLNTGSPGVHTWQCCGYNANGDGLWSNNRIFTVCVSGNSMCAPSLLSPDDGAEVLISTDQIFTCGTVSSATGYKIRFDAGTSYESTLQMDANRRFKLNTGSPGVHTWQSGVEQQIGKTGVPVALKPAIFLHSA